MSDQKSLRRDAPELWAGVVEWCREIGIDWPEDEIANVIGKIRARDMGDIPHAIGKVLEWCRDVERIGGDTEDTATVSIWREMPVDLIEISIGPGGEIQHRLTVSEEGAR